MVRSGGPTADPGEDPSGVRARGLLWLEEGPADDEPPCLHTQSIPQLPVSCMRPDYWFVVLGCTDTAHSITGMVFHAAQH